MKDENEQPAFDFDEFMIFLRKTRDRVAQWPEWMRNAPVGAIPRPWEGNSSGFLEPPTLEKAEEKKAR